MSNINVAIADDNEQIRQNLQEIIYHKIIYLLVLHGLIFHYLMNVVILLIRC